MAFRFTKASVFPERTAGLYYIDWAGEGDGEVRFSIESAPASDGPWTPASMAVYEAPPVVIALKGSLSATYTTWFRIKALSGNNVVAVSSAFDGGLQAHRNEYLRYREMLRRWNLELKKFTGKRALALRVKTFGTPASNVHPILNKPIGTENKDAHGQKFKGGYMPPVEIWGAYIDGPTDQTTTMSTKETGLTEVEPQQIFAHGFPTLRAYDIWVDPSSNVRYKIDKVDTVEYRGMVIKQIITANRLPVSDPAYKFSLEPFVPHILS